MSIYWINILNLPDSLMLENKIERTREKLHIKKSKL